MYKALKDYDIRSWITINFSDNYVSLQTITGTYNHGNNIQYKEQNNVL